MPPATIAPACTCRRFRPGEPFRPGEDCAVCWVEHHRHQPHQPRTATRPVQASVAEPYIKCPHLGAAVQDAQGDNQKAKCGACGGKDRQLFYCLHPAREPDKVTVADCRTCDYRPRAIGNAKVLILKNSLSPGDVLVMSAAIYSLHRANPGRFVTAVASSCDAVYEHNHDVVPVAEAMRLGGEEMQTHYPAVNQSNQRAIHFMQSYCEFFSQELDVPCPLATNRPMVYLSKRERTWISQVHESTGRPTKFWLLNAGHKTDFTCKNWGASAYQHVVDRCRGRVQFVQVGEATKGHHHPPLRNVLNFVGRTDHRQLIRLAYHADGGLGGVTFLQHLCAAWEKPYFCIMGGREPVAWNSYPRQQLFHTVGMLDCCRSGGCWRSRTVPLGDGDAKDKSLCENPVFGEETVPRCMAMIDPDHVAEKILSIQA